MKGLKINTKIAQSIPSESLNKMQDEFNIMKKAKLECSQITENIFVSGYNVSLDYEFLIKNNFTHILNCATGSKTFKTEIFVNFEYLLLDLKDEPGFDIIYAIYSTIDFIENSVKKGGRVLIHCVEGISRGPALLASYFMWKYNLDKITSITQIKDKRKCVDINLGFMVQLGKWEELLKFNKELKFFNFGGEGNISLIDKNDLVKNDLKNNSYNFNIILMLHQNKFYKIVTDSFIHNDLFDKVNHFVYLLQTYDNYPSDCICVNVDRNLLDQNFFGFEFGEEIQKYSY